MKARPLGTGIEALVAVMLAIALSNEAMARKPIRDAFFLVYTSAVGTRLDNLPGKAGHCGLCHFDFDGGGARNPYGLAIAAYTGGLSNATYSNAVVAARLPDSDSDGYTSGNEITNRVFPNTPTFPGLSAANLGQVLNIPTAAISSNLTPALVADTTPPGIFVLSPNGGETMVANHWTNITWLASDAGSGVAAIHLYLSLDNGVTFTPIALSLSNSGTYAWVPANRPTTIARIKAVAIDGAANTSNDMSNAAFVIMSPPGGIVPTTLRDFDMPGTQPFEGGAELPAPEDCASCHGGYDASAEAQWGWMGSMMAHASLDPLFEANMVIANQDAPDSGDLCLRCHLPRGWLAGRSVPTDGSRMLPADAKGVSCMVCHTMVNPVYDAGSSPAADSNILAALSFRGTNHGNGMYVIDPSASRRGPFTNHVAPHSVEVSSFHRSSAFCGTCHDVSNPAFVKDANGVYQPNTLNATSSTFSAHQLAPVERTYSEWLASSYNAPAGVYAPRFAGNKADGLVSTCQDCHMSDVSGMGANPTLNTGLFVRADMPSHDLTGGSTWIPGLLTNLYPGQVNAGAIQAGIDRATILLQKAATLGVTRQGGLLRVTVTNETGHKLPTGYPEGRRVWINVRFYDAASNLLSESGAYDPNAGVLTHDGEARVYEVHPGIDTNVAALTGLPVGPSLHFVLNNRIFFDNRIPPRGFSNSTFATFGGAPVGHSYADGQHWDTADYAIPSGTRRAEVGLYYQSTSKEFIEFLRDENTTNEKGQEMYDLWNNNGKCPPTLMTSAVWTTPAPSVVSIEPECGPASGGSSFRVTAINAQTGSTVTFGGIIASNVVVVSDTSVTGRAPPGLAGPVDVSLISPDGQTGTLQQAWTYALPPAFAGIQSVTAGVESAGLHWSAATSSYPVTYRIFVATVSGGQSFDSPLIETGATTLVVSPLDPGSTNPVSYHFVVRASDNCGGSDQNVVELSLQPALDPAGDQDGDGIDNAYEQAHALDPFDLADADDDPDEDNYSNLDEFIAVTDPRASSSHFRIVSVGSDGLAFSSAVGRLYLTEFGSLASGHWDPLGTNQPGTGGMLQIPLTNDGANLNYRLKVFFP